ncbi:MAG: fasciclin domain-containing protein [Microscillaceae bacterium]|nr:fasciclin domain-containing protein [Microscillaceae bacterium]
MKSLNFFKILSTLVLPIVIGLSACEFDTEKAVTPPTSLFQVISNDPTLTLLTAAIRNVSANSNPRVDLVAALSNTDAGRYTVFAPVDPVFLGVPAGLGGPFNQAFMDNPANANTLAAVLRYHVVPREINSGEFPATRIGYATLLPNNQFFLARAGSNININSATGANGVALANFYANNGVVHKLSTLLTPATLTAPNNANIATAAQGAGLTLLLRVIQYVDANTTPSANLAATLASNGTFTVFAPNNAAFSFLDGDSSGDLSDAELAGVGATALAAIIRRHVIAAPRYAIDLGTSQAALQGTLTFNATTTTVTNGTTANIVMANVRTGNGIVHVIDTVLR